ncbi:hypothetical protein [Ulvibacterium marinum]|uniref:hypothetical protein n=1 Tax=Ulvibacterium marinum TaxID=2419782 RepID=UPI00249427C2|nr:hypothetical protein [Ulvibacterium marinum]
MRAIKIIVSILFVIIIGMFFIAKRISKGIGDSLENGIKGIYEISKTMDSTDGTKIDSEKEVSIQVLHSQKTFLKGVYDKIICSDDGCEGVYIGPEFIEGSDIAHQFSNVMSKKVGDKLKELYKLREYSKVDFSKIKMSTKGMGSGNVVYELNIPFKKVKEKCDAYTSFDHVGGWDHKPALSTRKEELNNVLMEGQTLDISELKTTPEGLQEYWIQWKNKVTQSDCK